jgi:MFS family permease
MIHLRLPSRLKAQPLEAPEPSASAVEVGPVHRARATVRRSQRLVTIEAIPASLALAVSDFVVPLGLALKATLFQLALLGTVPHLLAALGQLFTPVMIRRMGSRKAVVRLSGVLSAVAWLGAMSIPVLPVSLRVWALLVFAVLAFVFFNLPNPAWGSWISDLVPLKRRGRYLGFRSIIASAAALVVFLVGGVFLDSLKDRAILAFAALFGFAAINRLISVLIYSRVTEPHLHESRIKQPHFMHFLAELPHNNLGHFLLYSFVLNFGVNIAGPFFTVYQLRDLQFSYTTYMTLSVVSAVSTIIGLRIWGPLSDRFGNVVIIRVSALGVPIIPVLWLLVDSPLDAVYMQVFGGLAWAGLTLCAGNFIFECSNNQNRANNVAHYNALNGTAIFLGGIVGGLVVGHLPETLGSNLLTIFVVSGALRLAAALVFLPFVAEVRRKGRGSEVGSVTR